MPRFFPLANLYAQTLNQAGSDLRVSDFETCNFLAYHCPHCGASDRDRLYALYLARRLAGDASPQRELRLLDIAPAEALSRHIRRKRQIHYRTADLFMPNVDDRVDVTSMDCYTNESFDVLICSHVLEHVSDDRKAMAELNRVLRPGGWGIVMVPIRLGTAEIREDPSVTTEAGRWKHFGQGDHVRLYSRAGFVQRLESAGFAVLELGEPWFEPGSFQRCGISPASVLYVVEKPKAGKPSI